MKLANNIRRMAKVKTTGYPKKEDRVRMLKYYFEIAQLLLDRGANPNLQDLKGKTPLMKVINRHSATVQLLLERGADPNLQDLEGKTVFDLVDEENLHLLIDPSIVDPKTGISNLMIIVCNRSVVPLRSIIDRNPDLDLDQQDQDGNTPLIYAVVNRRADNVELLLDRGADPNLANNGGGTPLAYAAESNQKEIEQMLLDAGAR
jgi:ankyrin repeat protein